MPVSILFPLIYGAACLMATLIFRVLPIKGKNEAIMRGIKLDSLIQGMFGLLVALVSALLRLEEMTVLYIVVGGAIILGGVVMVPTMLSAMRENRDQNL